MKIVLIYPSLCDSSFNVSGTPILFNHMHRGLCYLSSVCKKDGFTDINLIDLRMLCDWNEFKSRVAELKPKVVGITVMSPDFNYAVKCIDIIKEVDTNIKTVVGGMHPTIMADEMVVNNKVDYIITGEAESAFVKLLHAIKAGRASVRVIKGELADVNKLPFEDRELFDCLERPYDFFLPPPFVTVLASRGCPYQCKFCAPGSKLMHGNRIRKRTVDNVIEELKFLRDTYGFKSLQFWDDCFGVDKKWVFEFCEKYTKNGFKEPFMCLMRSDIISRNVDMMKRLKKAGMAMALIGFESGNDRVLKFVNKGTTVKENLTACRICQKTGIKVWALHMYGMPTETNEEALDTMRIIRKMKPWRSSTAFYTPFPGSYFHEYCKERDLSLIGDHDGFVTFPEDDIPKIKNIDYDFMRKAAHNSKELSLRVKLRIRLEKISAHKASKTFRIKFEKEIERNPSLNKMTTLKIAHQAGRI